MRLRRHSSQIVINKAVRGGGVSCYGQPQDFGGLNFNNWLLRDPKRAEKFVSEVMKGLGWKVREVAKFNCIPQEVLWGVLLAEIIQIQEYAEYKDLAGNSLGPGQLTMGMVEYYGLKRMDPLNLYWRYPIRRDQLIDKGINIELVGDKVRKQLLELSLAGGGGGSSGIKVPALQKVPAANPAFKPWESTLNNDQPVITGRLTSGGSRQSLNCDQWAYSLLNLRSTKGAADAERAKLAYLVGILAQMNDTNPGAVGKPTLQRLYQMPMDEFFANQGTFISNALYLYGLDAMIQRHLDD